MSFIFFTLTMEQDVASEEREEDTTTRGRDIKGEKDKRGKGRRN